jgi:hypothetical protein
MVLYIFIVSMFYHFIQKIYINSLFLGCIMAKLEDLPAEEKIKKLKELQKKKRKELAEAAKKIKESEVELTDRQKFVEKVPIPEVAKEDLAGLSATAKEILRVQRGITGRKDEEEVEKEVSLEEAIEEVAPKPGDKRRYELPEDDPLKQMNTEYVLQLSQRPVGELQQDVEQMNRKIEDKGYVNPEEQKALQYHHAAIDEKIKAGEQGSYANWSEEVAQAALLTKQVTGRLLDSAYQANKVHDSYKTAG